MPRGTSPFTPAFDDLVNSLLTEWHVPGTSIAIIDGPNTFTKGYGHSQYPNTKATPETLYYTASTTKSFTAAAVALLIDDSQSHTKPLTWTTPLSTLLPTDFILANPTTTSQITLEDALSHRTGLPEHSYHFTPSGASPKTEVRKLRHLPLTATPREKYMYNSFMYTAVSVAVEKITGVELGSFLRARIWGPLGMRNTYWSIREAEADGGDIARGYAWVSGSGYSALEYPEYSELSGAGCMISSVVDYAAWVRCMMRGGVLSEGAREALTAPRIVCEGPTNLFPGTHLYGLGWRVDGYRGQRVVWHTGSIAGFGSVVMFLPGVEWGVVIFGNATVRANMMQQVLYMYLLDELLGTPGVERVDWGRVIKGKVEGRRAALARARERLYPDVPCPVVLPALGIQEYGGRYWHPGYGGMELVVGADGEGLVGDRLCQEFSMLIVMEHVSGEFWVARLQEKNKDPRDHEVVWAEFRLGPDEVREVGVDLEPTMNGELIWFQRIEQSST